MLVKVLWNTLEGVLWVAIIAAVLCSYKTTRFILGMVAGALTVLLVDPKLLAGILVGIVMVSASELEQKYRAAHPPKPDPSYESCISTGARI